MRERAGSVLSTGGTRRTGLSTLLPCVGARLREGRGKAAEAFFDEVLRRGAVDLSRGIFGMLQRCSRRARLRVVSTTGVPHTHSSPARPINIMFKQEISLMPFAPAQKYRRMYDGL